MDNEMRINRPIYNAKTYDSFFQISPDFRPLWAATPWMPSYGANSVPVIALDFYLLPFVLIKVGMGSKDVGYKEEFSWHVRKNFEGRRGSVMKRLGGH